jgi:carotenoid cleavage dioxygenase-like enzyme
VFEFNDDGDNSFSFTDPTRRALTTTPPRSLTLPNVFGLFHDFVVTKNYVIFTQAPTVFGDLAANALQVVKLALQLVVKQVKQASL